MGWLQRLFGLEKPSPEQARAETTPAEPTVPPERIGLSGEYDQSGLAKRVAAAFDDDPALDDIETLYVAQTGSTVVLKGSVPNQQILSKMVSVATEVKGTTAVETDQVKVG
ncbi:MAG: BON domain-containing protein [Gemmatimonadaceae bacterium]|nr:BON domain-containing protein [Gloeobacterales cyanobacterium ES-bin-141]